MGTNDTMAWHDDQQGIAPHGRPSGSCGQGAPHSRGQRLVAAGMARRDLPQGSPGLLLEGGSPKACVQWQIEGGALAAEVTCQLVFGLPQQGIIQGLARDAWLGAGHLVREPSACQPLLTSGKQHLPQRG